MGNGTQQLCLHLARQTSGHLLSRHVKNVCIRQPSCDFQEIPKFLHACMPLLPQSHSLHYEYKSLVLCLYVWRRDSSPTRRLSQSLFVWKAIYMPGTGPSAMIAKPGKCSYRFSRHLNPRLGEGSQRMGRRIDLPPGRSRCALQMRLRNGILRCSPLYLYC